jgi:hypothetical protein
MAFKKFVDIIETLQDIAQICARAEPRFEHRGACKPATIMRVKMHTRQRYTYQPNKHLCCDTKESRKNLKNEGNLISLMSLTFT